MGLLGLKGLGITGWLFWVLGSMREARSTHLLLQDYRQAGAVHLLGLPIQHSVQADHLPLGWCFLGMSVPSSAFLLLLRLLPCSQDYQLLMLFHKLVLSQTLHILHGLHAAQLLREQELLLGLRGRLWPCTHQLFSTDWGDRVVPQLLSRDWGDWAVPGLLSTNLSLISTYMLRVEMVTPQGRE